VCIYIYIYIYIYCKCCTVKTLECSALVGQILYWAVFYCVVFCIIMSGNLVGVPALGEEFVR
jgi:hypothetical protein